LRKDLSGLKTKGKTTLFRLFNNQSLFRKARMKKAATCAAFYQIIMTIASQPRETIINYFTG